MFSALKVFVAAFLISLAAFYAIAFVASVPYPYDRYFALYTLGSSATAEHYFPGDVVDILPGARMSWYVAVYNHMGTVQLVKVTFTILNETMVGPDQLNNTPSARESFYETTRLLVTNETWILPMSWSILNATSTPNATSIHSLIFNGQALTDNVETEALHGYNYRIVIELWVYDDASGNFSYVWTANDGARSAWNQIWFNMTRISLLPPAPP